MKNAAGQMYAREFQHRVRGYLSGSSQSAITSAMNSLSAALATPYQNFLFKMDDGTNSATTLINGTSISGVTVIEGPDYAESVGSEYAFQRQFTFTVRAEYALPNTNNILLSFTESVDFSGGGPKYILREAVVGPPQKQQIREQTIFYARQSGSSEGYTKEPVVPPPIWPRDQMEAVQVTRVTPDRVGPNKYQGYKVSWSYNFAASAPLIGRPHLWT